MGLSANKAFKETNTWNVDTAYLVTFGGNWYLNGRITNDTIGRNGGKIQTRVDLKYFKKKSSEIDIFLDADQGIMRIKRVGSKDADNHEVEIMNINNSNTDGWVPHLIFEQSKNCTQKIRIARIDESWYGKEKYIEWTCTQ